MTGLETVSQVGITTSLDLTEDIVVDELDYHTGEVIGQQTIPAGKQSFIYEIHPISEELCLQWQGLPTGVFAPIKQGEVS